MTEPTATYSVQTIGYIRSSLRSLADAPRQGSEGAPDAWLEVQPAFAVALRGMAVGDEIIVITWLHEADRNILEAHPRADPRNPLTGVFSTRAPHRPKTLGQHRVTVSDIEGPRLRVGPIEVIDGTPVIDIKAVLAYTRDG
jgi:tRNA-Thr(GGU) m(6)t(6)A37 methyltransferase TsaA